MDEHTIGDMVEGQRNATTDVQKREVIERLYALWLKNPAKRLGWLCSIRGQEHLADFDLIRGMEERYDAAP